MDSVKFGRALGIGARLAGKTIAQAVDAAASPNPRAAAKPAPQRTATVIPPPVVRAAASAKATREGVKRGGKRFGEAVWGPTARAGKVLWLEVTGVFFALVAAGGAQSVWIHRVGISSTASTYERQHFWLSIGMFCLFAYFCVSSFVRANRKSRG
ncbi:hypothetical protein SAMN05421771_0348 [Granulicella pectinivorans]|jgi:hypothetical protein|uniref:Uncharacterized protein n=1 Tax=Granulicella pectinivorans TaxID=474950 RepID=A0A1I6L6W1_9BACT|nr:hypothetical protein [Granulicella pectinivorans]SFR99167.1 hypothetical protein SAMN05421771_0348 [Granulicella pectinivorans]